MSVRGSKYRHLLGDVDVRRWFENVARGSEVTAEVYLRRLGAFCEYFGIIPRQLREKREDELYNMLLDYVSHLEAKGVAGSYVKSALKAVKSWLSHNGIEVRRKIKIRGADDTPTLKEERVPTQQELKRIFLSADKKVRALCVLVAHSGLRLMTVGNYRGTDGLRISDLPEMRVEGDIVEFEKIPTMIIVRPELSKAGHQYFTFLSEEGCQYLKDYLEERLLNGERLAPKSPLIRPKVVAKPFIRTVNVGDAIRGAIRSAGFKWRPYVLRSYFDTQLMLAESKGLVLRDYRQFWMGHKGDIENRYTTNKYRLPESVIEDMREAYRRSQAYLQTVGQELSRESMVEELKRHLLLVTGFSPEEINNLDLKGLSDEEFQEIIRKRLLGRIKAENCLQRVVNLEEVDKYLQMGWSYVDCLPDGRVVIRKDH
ncbi:MAG: site-specific integrase [Candidatus Bathyarchaeota archaeon]|nr:site-specific integrase [Candidatus Bathyarchaeota archaeon]